MVRQRRHGGSFGGVNRKSQIENPLCLASWRAKTRSYLRAKFKNSKKFFTPFTAGT
jgi:hypothetical protein